MIRAKFYVQSITLSKHWDSTKGNLSVVKLTPVASGSEENKAFFEATPSGLIELGVLNAEAAAAFEVGKEYFVDFTAA